MTVLRILERSDGVVTGLEGKFVAAYDPAYHSEGAAYDGGLLLVTDSAAEALQFADAGAALEKWREAYGIRPDGKPNRPLTAFTVGVENF